MGFDQELTKPHFLLFTDGGAIDVSVKNPSDAKNCDAIRSHLPHIAMMFGEGNFETPMLVHDSKNVPGTSVITARKDGYSVPVRRDAQRRPREYRDHRSGIIERRPCVPEVPDRGPQDR